MNYLGPGGKWSGENYVAALDAFAGKPLHAKTPAKKIKVHIRRVRELLPFGVEDMH